MATLPSSKRRPRRTRNAAAGGEQRVAVGYIRVSTVEQAVGGESLDAQRVAIEQAAAARGLRLVSIESDEGVSGRTVDRPGLVAALDAVVKAGGVLIARNLSRLSRRAGLTHQVLDLLDHADAGLVLLDEGIDTDAGGVCGRLILGVLAAVAQHQAEQGAETTRAVLRHLRKQGRRTGGTVPYGFKDAGGTLVEVPAEQQVIARMIALSSEGLGVRRIAQRLNDEGVSPRGVRSNGTPSGGRWHATQVHRILRAAQAAA